MSFLHRQRSLSAFHKVDKEQKLSSKPLPLVPSPAAIENVPQKHTRPRTSSNIAASRIIRRVSNIFSPRKKMPSNLKLVNSPSCSSSIHESVESEDDIRRPSGLGSAVSITSNRSLPPSPFLPPPREDDPFQPSEEFSRMRAISSPNLLRSISLKVRGKPRVRRVSIAPTPGPGVGLLVPQILQSPPADLQKSSFPLPEEVVVLILSHLPRSAVASCAAVSPLFASAACASLYSVLNLDALALIQLEKLVALLASRRDLTDQVTTFICRKWPPFFLADSHEHGGINRNGYVIQQSDALLTATFTLALERMSNLISLTLPSFDLSLLAHHTAFGLKSLTFLNHTTSDSETRALFTWLDGQTNIDSLLFPNLEDASSTGKLDTRCDLYNSRPGTAPSSPFLQPFPTSISAPYASPSSSPRSARFHMPSSSFSPPPVTSSPTPFGSPTLLPNLTTLHATPAFCTLLSLPTADNSSTSTSQEPQRPLRSVRLNINTTLYTGLRPAALMSSLRGIDHLSLKFSENVDRRTFEKVIGAAGASLGLSACASSSNAFDVFGPTTTSKSKTKTRTDTETEQEPRPESEAAWFGLRSLEVAFHTSASLQSGRDEALYKSLQVSFPRYKHLRSLRLFISPPSSPSMTPSPLSVTSPLPVAEKEKDATHASTEDILTRDPSALEQLLIETWVKACPSLESVTLFSGASWQKTTGVDETEPVVDVY
ncbi:hypothetical protein B0H34DRAFT_739403 [Crassisporium funariophilum]|nr:hypothetical protein B0H34DRAFT_739403 [Crassisporium funariophilum]